MRLSSRFARKTSVSPRNSSDCFRCRRSCASRPDMRVLFQSGHNGPHSLWLCPAVPGRQINQNSFPEYSPLPVPAKYGKYSRKIHCWETELKCWRISYASGHGKADKQSGEGQWKFCRCQPPLNHQYLILGVADNGVLFFLNGAHNVF